MSVNLNSLFSCIFSVSVQTSPLDLLLFYCFTTLNDNNRITLRLMTSFIIIVENCESPKSMTFI